MRKRRKKPPDSKSIMELEHKKKKKSVQQLIDIKYYRSTISSIGKVLILKKNHEKTSIGSINIKEYVGGKAVVIRFCVLKGLPMKYSI